MSKIRQVVPEIWPKKWSNLVFANILGTIRDKKLFVCFSLIFFWILAISEVAKGEFLEYEYS